MSARDDPGAAGDLPNLSVLLNEVLRAPNEHRSARLEELCSLHPDSAERLRVAYTDAVAWRQPPMTADGKLPERIGPYRILGEIGTGGMGTVYKAERRGAIRQLVAIKVVRRGLVTKQVLARFALERRALAAMSHRCIARVYDAGATEDGAPYFVMEYVEGLPIHEHCDRNRLSVRERIDLFQQVCRGVQRAHLKGIVHRDLKPQNVLVVREGDEFVPKILDFGLAKATNRDFLDVTLVTEKDQIMGTPEYMSPEQASGEGEMVDALADVYSLGVMLYELLVGELPFSRSELQRAGILGSLALIREREPPKPSARLIGVHEVASDRANRRRTTIMALRRELQGDLDWVILKAMAKEPVRRYQSANGLAEDLQRYLSVEPVLAGPPSVGYRTRILFRKYRVQALAAAAVFVSLVAGMIVAWRFASIANANAATVAEQNVRFRRLKVGLHLRRAMGRYEELVARPAWPEAIPAIEAWQQGDAKDVLDSKPEVAAALQELRAGALSAAAEDRLDDRSSHPRFAELVALRTQVRALEDAQRVREGGVASRLPLPADLATADARRLNDHAWSRCAPVGEGREIFGQEGEAVVAAEAALEKVRAGDASVVEAVVLDTLAWALLGTGQDEAARTHSREALRHADGVRSTYERQHERLIEAVVRAPAQLQRKREELAVLESVVGGRQMWRFEDEANQFLHDWLAGLMVDIEDFSAGPAVRVSQMLAWARYLKGLQGNADYVVAWRSASAALGLQPQTGLWPIGRNAKTGMWEFYDLRSAWDPAGGKPELIRLPSMQDYDSAGDVGVHEATGIVFVFVPACEYWMGAQTTRGERNFDELALVQELPPHLVKLDPFFIARHELTQGQWLRLSGKSNPSYYQGDGATVGVGGIHFGLAHPVEQVSWVDCNGLLTSHGLQLPWETQWECACRAGTSTPWWTGEERGTLLAGGPAANLADQSAKKLAHATWREVDDWPEYDDGHPFTAPVDALRANPWGLHHVHGNVWEWCRDEYGSYDGVHRSPGHRVARSGCYANAANKVRSAMRTQYKPDTKGYFMGVRPAREVQR